MGRLRCASIRGTEFAPASGARLWTSSFASNGMSIQIHGKTDGEVLTTGLPAVTFNRILGITELPPGQPSPRWKIGGGPLALTAFVVLFIFLKAARKMRLKYLP